MIPIRYDLHWSLSSGAERLQLDIDFEHLHISLQGEFLCPVCRGLANSVLPALPGDAEKLCRLPMPSVSASDSVTYSPLADQKLNSLCLQQALSLLTSAADISRSNEILDSVPVHHSGRLRPTPESLFRVLCKMYFPGNDKIVGSGRVSHSMIMWDTLKYSLMSTEISARSRRTSLSPEYSQNALIKELKSSTGFVLSLLLKILQSTRTKDTLSFLLRLRGINLFAESICSGFSAKEFTSRSFRQGGIATVFRNFYIVFVILFLKNHSLLI